MSSTTRRNYSTSGSFAMMNTTSLYQTRDSLAFHRDIVLAITIPIVGIVLVVCVVLILTRLFYRQKRASRNAPGTVNIGIEHNLQNKAGYVEGSHDEDTAYDNPVAVIAHHTYEYTSSVSEVHHAGTSKPCECVQHSFDEQNKESVENQKAMPDSESGYSSLKTGYQWSCSELLEKIRSDPSHDIPEDLLEQYTHKLGISQKVGLIERVRYDAAVGVFDKRGGELQLPEITLTIPNGALSEPTPIYMMVVLNPSKSENFISPVIKCGPNGLQFNIPLLLELPICSKGEVQMSCKSQQNSDSDWITTGSSLVPDSDQKENQTVVTMKIEHFTGFGVTAEANGGEQNGGLPKELLFVGFQQREILRMYWATNFEICKMRIEATENTATPKSRQVIAPLPIVYNGGDLQCTLKSSSKEQCHVIRSQDIQILSECSYYTMEIEEQYQKLNFSVRHLDHPDRSPISIVFYVAECGHTVSGDHYRNDENAEPGLVRPAAMDPSEINGSCRNSSTHLQEQPQPCMDQAKCAEFALDDSLTSRSLDSPEQTTCINMRTPSEPLNAGTETSSDNSSTLDGSLTSCSSVFHVLPCVENGAVQIQQDIPGDERHDDSSEITSGPMFSPLDNNNHESKSEDSVAVRTNPSARAKANDDSAYGSKCESTESPHYLENSGKLGNKKDSNEFEDNE